VKYLLDTPLLSELMRAHANDWLARWMDAFYEEEICLSALTIGEIVKSIESEPDLLRKEELYRWLNEELLVRFHGRIIPLDMDIIMEWGKVSAECEAKGKPISALDGLIAATVRVKGGVLITYNREIFSVAGIEVSDPWQG
jgi:predicted nucleic acid-binding protein